MKKFISWLGAFVILSSSTAVIISCSPSDGGQGNKAVDFSGVKINELTVRANVKTDTYREVLQKDDEEGTNFSVILENYVTAFADENNLGSLTLYSDYDFTIKVPNPYHTIDNPQTVVIIVSAYPNNSKIFGHFEVTVNLIDNAVSIDNLAIPSQNPYNIDHTKIQSFQNLVDDLNDKLVKDAIIKICPSATLINDYGVFVQGVPLEQSINDSDKSKKFHINVQAVSSSVGNISQLKGAYSFDVTLQF